ncbi:cell division protein ZapA [Bacillus sp. HMF5848]|uniref:cell division protein ZapA n=1 Tax=Bacillus sp. HMF5848 TaxID=2495421 RepID=UPI000F7A9E6D|nr:cell division protein ZapA [Bacillus sp. HMF5848]RSK28093.1 cell division protein ZapA [Bacillus sp. HMF5848]
MHLAEKKKLTVDIYGQTYSIVGDESTSHVRMVAAMVDDKMHELAKANPQLDINKLAVLTAVNVVHDYVKLKQEYDQIMKQIEKG